ncbi:MAG: DUF1697 domain-containing protein [Acidimicrobiales bacterium]
MPNDTVRFAAFMRAINVGKRRVKMAALIEHVEALGFVDVQTLIASGNVAFSAPENQSVDDVRVNFDGGLSERLGFEVVSAFRTPAEIDEVIAAEPFGAPGDPGWTDDDVVHVSFLLGEPAPEAAERLAALDTPEDRFAIVGRELYWRRRGKLSESPHFATNFAKLLGVESTARRLDTVVRMRPLLR